MQAASSYIIRVAHQLQPGDSASRRAGLPCTWFKHGCQPRSLTRSRDRQVRRVGVGLYVCIGMPTVGTPRGYACRYLSTIIYPSSACIPAYAVAFILGQRQCRTRLAIRVSVCLSVPVCSYVRNVYVMYVCVCLLVCMLSCHNAVTLPARVIHVPKDHALQSSLTTVNAAL